MKQHPFGIAQFEHNFSSSDRDSMVSYLDENFYAKNLIEQKFSGYQTLYTHNLFYIPTKVFQKLSATFIQSVRDYVNMDEIKDRIDNGKYKTQCWCYLNWESSGRPGKFHAHNYDSPTAISGIFYLKVSNDNCGTNFIVGGNTIDIPSEEGSWFIFPSSYGHNAGIEKEKRYVISSDIWFP